jgi:hypothetical protein
MFNPLSIPTQAPQAVGGAVTTWSYVRIRSTASGDMVNQPGISLAEFRIASTSGGSNVAGTATATATQSGFGSTPSQAIDDDTATVWQSNFDNTWPIDYVLHFPSAIAMAEAQIVPRAGGNSLQAPATFTIDVSNDGSTWTNKVTRTGQTYDTLQTPVVISIP